VQLGWSSVWAAGSSTHNKKPTRCHLIFYYSSYRLNMFLTLICPSSGVCDYAVDYHIGRIVLGLLYVGCKVQLGWSRSGERGVGTASTQLCRSRWSPYYR
jgi:hypothetical protein